MIVVPSITRGKVKLIRIKGGYGILSFKFDGYDGEYMVTVPKNRSLGGNTPLSTKIKVRSKGVDATIRVDYTKSEIYDPDQILSS